MPDREAGTPEVELAAQHLEVALDADEMEEVHFHVRTAIQLLKISELDVSE